MIQHESLQIGDNKDTTLDMTNGLLGFILSYKRKQKNCYFGLWNDIDCSK